MHVKIGPRMISTRGKKNARQGSGTVDAAVSNTAVQNVTPSQDRRRLLKQRAVPVSFGKPKLCRDWTFVGAGSS